tara:strand:+ start:228 stop:530 length:303 start_codon:yes stop_codon:yes gene_type:complete
MFQVAIDDADRIDESTEDITAAAIPPSPRIATTEGVKWCNTIGRISAESGSETPKAPQSVALPIKPMAKAGTAAVRLNAPAHNESRRAIPGLSVASTRWK